MRERKPSERGLICCRSAGRREGHQRVGHSRRRALTLAELLVVITIIVLLVAILMPALNKAYTTALRSADAALIHQLATACEAYQQVFNVYPPSTWDHLSLAPADPNDPAFVGHHQDVYWPPPEWRRDGTKPQLPLVGAAKLFSALVGFNTVGCYDPSNTWGPWDPSKWVQPCGELTYRGILFDSDRDGQEDKTYGPYFEPNDKQQTFVQCKWSDTESKQRTFASRFARQNPSFKDEKRAPILYYRAVQNPVDGDDTDDTVDAWEIYWYFDNFPITDAQNSASGNDPYAASGDAAKNHPLYAPSSGRDADGDGEADYYGIVRPDLPSGAPQAPQTPFNANSFILISPGPDGEYFTEDDVTNFR